MTQNKYFGVGLQAAKTNEGLAPKRGFMDEMRRYLDMKKTTLILIRDFAHMAQP